MGESDIVGDSEEARRWRRYNTASYIFYIIWDSNKYRYNYNLEY
jgi:hypothetical protein